MTISRIFSTILPALLLLACNLALALTPPPAPTATPVAAAPAPTTTPLPPTGTPLPLDDLARAVIDQLLAEGLIENETAFVDAVGRDIAERRVIEVYQQVSPAVVNISTQVLQRSFFFEAIPTEGPALVLC